MRIAVVAVALIGCRDIHEQPYTQYPDAYRKPDAGLPLVTGICDVGDGDLISPPPTAHTPPCAQGLDSPDPLFGDIGELPGEYAALHALCTRMNRAPDTRDDLTDPELAADLHAFFLSLVDKPPLQRALANLPADPEVRANTLEGVWLTHNAFEHVFCGELSFNGTVGGLHMWSEYYAEERAGRMNYICTVEGPNDPVISTSSFRWLYDVETGDSALKPVGGFIVGASPACLLGMGYAALGAGAHTPLVDNAPSFRADTYGEQRDWVFVVGGVSIVTMYPRADLSK